MKPPGVLLLLSFAAVKLLSAQQFLTLSLHDAKEAGTVSAAWTAKGLLVSAEVRRPAPATPQVELWLTASAEPKLPPVAWGNQFGEEPGTTANCEEKAGQELAACLAWIKKQSPYRAAFPKLFLRRWRISPSAVEEAYASAAYRSLTPDEQKGASVLQPLNPPQARFALPPNAPNFSFEILVPWNAFPPADRLSLDRLGFQVDVRGGGLALTTLTPGPKLNGLPHISVAPPLVTRITACEYPLLGADIFREDKPAYYFPNEHFEVAQAFILQNDVRGYQYLPAPDSHSPAIRPVHFFEQELDKGEFLCGPSLAYKNATTLKRFPTLRLDAEKALAVKRLGDGTRLIKSGPNVGYSEFGSGQCGACPIVDFHIFALSPLGDVTEALAIAKRLDNEEYEIEIDLDWSKVTEYSLAGQQWTSTQYCLQRSKYENCGENPKATSPKNTTVRDLLKQ